MIDHSQFLTEIDAALSDDGSVAELRMQRANGQTVSLQFPVEAAATILLGIELQLGKVFEKQRDRLGGRDPRTFFAMGAMRAKSIQGALATDGTPLLSFVLESGLRIDFALPKMTISDLLDWLQEFDTFANLPMQPPY